MSARTFGLRAMSLGSLAIAAGLAASAALLRRSFWPTDAIAHGLLVAWCLALLVVAAVARGRGRVVALAGLAATSFHVLFERGPGIGGGWPISGLAVALDRSWEALPRWRDGPLAGTPEHRDAWERYVATGATLGSIWLGAIVALGVWRFAPRSDDLPPRSTDSNACSAPRPRTVVAPTRRIGILAAMGVALTFVALGLDAYPVAWATHGFVALACLVAIVLAAIGDRRTRFAAAAGLAATLGWLTLVEQTDFVGEPGRLPVARALDAAWAALHPEGSDLATAESARRERAHDLADAQEATGVPATRPPATPGWREFVDKGVALASLWLGVGIATLAWFLRGPEVGGALDAGDATDVRPSRDAGGSATPRVASVSSPRRRFLRRLADAALFAGLAFAVVDCLAYSDTFADVLGAPLLVAWFVGLTIVAVTGSPRRRDFACVALAAGLAYFATESIAVGRDWTYGLSPTSRVVSQWPERWFDAVATALGFREGVSVGWGVTGRPDPFEATAVNVGTIAFGAAAGFAALLVSRITRRCAAPPNPATRDAHRDAANGHEARPLDRATVRGSPRWRAARPLVARLAAAGAISLAAGLALGATLVIGSRLKEFAFFPVLALLVGSFALAIAAVVGSARVRVFAFVALAATIVLARLASHSLDHVDWRWNRSDAADEILGRPLAAALHAIWSLVRAADPNVPSWSYQIGPVYAPAWIDFFNTGVVLFAAWGGLTLGLVALALHAPRDER